MINIRDTEIQTLDGDMVIIPNNRVFENPIINMSTARLRRRTVEIGLGYEEDVDRAIEIFRQSPFKLWKGLKREPAPMINAMRMGESNLSSDGLLLG
jgi:small conductance mechanosensitive channel